MSFWLRCSKLIHGENSTLLVGKLRALIGSLIIWDVAPSFGHLEVCRGISAAATCI